MVQKMSMSTNLENWWNCHASWLNYMSEIPLSSQYGNNLLVLLQDAVLMVRAEAPVSFKNHFPF